MATLSLGYNAYYTETNFKVYGSSNSDYRTSDGSSDVDCGVLVFNNAVYAHLSNANIVNGIDITFQRKYEKTGSISTNGKLRFSFYPYVVQNCTINGAQLSYGSRAKLSANYSNSSEFSNTGWSNDSVSIQADAGNYQLGQFKGTTYLGAYILLKRMSGIYNYRGYMQLVSGTLRYTPRYYARFRSNDGSTTYGTDTVYNGGTTPTAPSVTAPTGYYLAGWTKTKGGTTTETLTAGNDTDVTWYAVFKKLTYTVRFVRVGGEEIKSGTYEYGSVPSCQTPTQASTAQYNYSFKGWNDGTTTYTGSLPAVTRPVTYVAVFTASIRSYTITFITEQERITKSIQYGESPGDYIDDPPGYENGPFVFYFSGAWKDTSTGIEYGTPLLPDVTGEATYQAVYGYVFKTYRINIYCGDNGRAIPSSIEHASAGEYAAIKIIPNAGYTVDNVVAKKDGVVIEAEFEFFEAEFEDETGATVNGFALAHRPTSQIDFYITFRLDRPPEIYISECSIERNNGAVTASNPAVSGEYIIAKVKVEWR